jgi:Glycine zipper 2TM domain
MNRLLAGRSGCGVQLGRVEDVIGSPPAVHRIRIVQGKDRTMKETGKKTMLALAGALTLITPITAAAAHDRGYGHGRGHDRHYDRGYDRDEYVGRGTRVWRGDDGRYYCRRSNGTTGLIIGAAGGALLGREVDSRGDRATGTILGAAIGGLIGRELQRGRARCR